VRGQRLPPATLYPRRKDPVPIVQKAGWAPGPVWTGAENLAPTGIRSSDHPPCSQSLYRLSYPTHDWTMHGDNFAFASNNSVSSVKFSTPLFVALATERKSEDVMPARHGGGRSDGTECNTGAASTASA
jgi:hypothetical protein